MQAEMRGFLQQDMERVLSDRLQSPNKNRI